MVSKNIFKIGLVSAGNIGNAVIGFVFLAATAKYLSLDDFGKYALLTSVLLLFNRIIDFGTTSIFVTKSLTENDSHKIVNSFHTVKLILLLASLPVSIGVLLLLGFSDIRLFLVFILGLIAYTLNLIFYAHFQKHEQFLSLILLNTFPAIVKGSFAVLIFLNILKLDIFLAFSIFSLSMFCILFLVPSLPRDARVIKLDFYYIKQLFTQGIPSGISQLVQESWAAINNTIAKILYGFNDVGIFSMANKISNIFALLSLSIFTVLLPKNAKRKSDKKHYDIKETAFLGVVVILLGIFAVIIAGPFLNIVFGGKFNDSIKILDILIITAAISAVNTFTENYFLVENKTKYILTINGLKILSFFIGAVVLIPIYQLYGLAYSNLVSAVISLTATSLLIKKLNA